MSETEKRAATLDLSAGRLCLNFANTMDWHRSAQPVEYLTDYRELVAWSEHAGILTPDAARRLLGEAARRPAEAEAVLARAVTLREAIYRLFSAVAAGLPPAAADLALFNAALPEALAHLQIAPTGEGFGWQWVGGEERLDRMLWPILWSAAELLTAGELDRVRECADDNCGWLFMDMSRNRSRRWCSMESCGNRAKARRYHQRHRAGDEETDGP